MWHTDTYWFDVAIATTCLMLGHLFFGRFVEHNPRWRRLLKSVLGIVLLVGTSVVAGRVWMFVELGAIVLGVLVVHGWWLPRKGVNGWTAEPRERYYEIIGLDQTGKPRGRRQPIGT
jgi:cadmium resistance protein CadD (predicted permease)